MAAVSTGISVATLGSTVFALPHTISMPLLMMAVLKRCHDVARFGAQIISATDLNGARFSLPLLSDAMNPVTVRAVP